MKIVATIILSVALNLLLVPVAVAADWSACATPTEGDTQCAESLKTKAAADAFVRQVYPAANALSEVRYWYQPAYNSVQINYDPPTRDAEFTSWSYVNGTERDENNNLVPYPSAWFSSESEALAQSLARVTELRAGACLAPVLVSQGPWMVNGMIPPNSDYGTGQNSALTYRYGIKDAEGNCTIIVESMDDKLVKQRDFACGSDSNWFNSNSPSGFSCKLRSSAVVSGPITDCDDSTCKESVGNPINILSGNKSYSHTDLNLDGMPFTRTYRSLSISDSGSIAKNWTHNFASRIIQGQLYVDDGGAEHKLQPISSSVYRTSNPEISFKKELNGEWTGFIGARYIDRYDVEGLLQSRSYSDAKAISIVRNERAEISSLVSSSGRHLLFNYNADYSVGTITASDGSYVEYSYLQPGGLLSEATFTGGVKLKYFYEDARFPGLLTSVINQNNEISATYTYDEHARAISTSAGSGVGSYTATYDDATNKVVVLDPMGLAKTYGFTPSPSRMLSSESYVEPNSGQQLSRQWQRSFMDYYLMSKIVDGANSTEVVRDPSRKLIKKTTYFEGTQRLKFEETDWHATYNLPIERRSFNASGTLVQRASWTYNARGQKLTASRIDPITSASRTDTWTYCEQADISAGACPLVGLITKFDGSRSDVSDVTSYSYRMADGPNCSADPVACPFRKGDLWKVTNALGQVTETQKYDGAGRVLSVKNANGVVTDFQYHVRGWLSAHKVRGTNNSVETDDVITQIEHWPTGLVKRVIQPGGAYTSYTYDGAQRLVQVQDNSGNKIVYTLDNAGNRIKEDTRDTSGLLRRTLSRIFNQLGQLETQADAEAIPTDFSYDTSGNVNTWTDALGRVGDIDYDPLGRLKRTLQNVGGISAETKYAYDTLDNLIQVTDPKGLNTGYIYNGLGDLTQLTSPDTGTTVYTYDTAGNRKTQTDSRSRTTTFSYNILNRLTTAAYNTAALNTSYAYDAAQNVCVSGETFSKGRLTSITDASGTTKFCYDRFGNLVRKVQSINGILLTVRYGYTKSGSVSRLTYPDGTVSDYVRNAEGAIKEVGVTQAGGQRKVLLNQVSYAPFGPATGWRYGNGRELQRPLNQNYQPIAILDPALSGLNLGFGYDAVGNLSQLTAANSTLPLVKFSYDALNRLTAFRDGVSDAAIESYTYDKTGNRTSFTNSAGAQAYTYPSTSHRLTKVGATTRSYDSAGNTTQIGGTAREFVYDDTGRMSQVKNGSVVKMNYQYNGQGQQVRQYLGAANTYTIFDEGGRWLGDYDGTGAALQQALWMDDLPVGLMANGNQLHYIQPDHLGTPRVVVEVLRNVPVWQWDLRGEAFGSTLPNENPDGDATAFVLDMRFPGQRYDAASGLNQNGFRDYEAATGRYPTSDPIGQRGGINTYAYAVSNPLTWFDPDGLEAGVGTYPGYYPPLTNPTPGARPLSWPSAGAIPWCLNPIVAGIVLMTIPGNIGQDASCSDDPMKRRQECRDDDDEECEKRREREETLCRLLAGPRYPGDPERAIRICQSAAFRRYAECLRGTPESNWPPLTGIDTPI